MPWDVNDPTQRKKAEAMIDLQEPHLLISSPMCTAFSHIQNLKNARRDPIIVEQVLVKARAHLSWCCKFTTSRSTDEPIPSTGAQLWQHHGASSPVWEHLQQTGVRRIVADQCQLSQQMHAGDPLRNAIGFMPNAPELLHSLDRRCFAQPWLYSRPQGDSHAECLRKSAPRAAIFQEEFCLTIFWGFRNRLLADRHMRKDEVEVVPSFEGEMIDENE